jgi:hypothetical protein
MTATFPVIDISGFAQGMSLCGPELQRRFRLPSKKSVFLSFKARRESANHRSPERAGVAPV